jgi:hypothetical protein
MNGISDREFIQDAYIQEGVSPVPGVVIVASTIGDDYDNPKNRIGVRKQDSWLEFGLSGEAVLSIDATDDGLAYVLGENGTVVRFNWQTPGTKDELRASRKVFANAAVARIGPLRRIRVLGADVICAGSVGQAYCLRDERFEAFPVLKVDGQEATIEDIAGTGRKDIVAVTSDGYAAHFDGSQWRVLDLPTNTSLTSICALGSHRYAISGKTGTIIVGDKSHWNIISPIDSERSYWGIAADNGIIYVAHLGGIDKVVDQGLAALDIQGKDELQFTVLRDSSDGVWSFAGRTIGVIRNDTWHTLLRAPL